MLAVLQLIVDVILFAIVIVFVLRESKSAYGKAVTQETIDQSKEVARQLRKLIDESDRASRDIFSALNRKEQDISRKIAILDKKLSVSAKNSVSGEGRRMTGQNFSTRTRKQAMAAKMAKSGFSSEQIARQIKLPLGEVELMLGIDRQTEL